MTNEMAHVQVLRPATFRAWILDLHAMATSSLCTGARSVRSYASLKRFPVSLVSHSTQFSTSSGSLSETTDLLARLSDTIGNPRTGLASSKPYVPKYIRAQNQTADDSPKPDLYHLHVQATRNNTILTLTDPEGMCLTSGHVTAGMLGFKGVQRSSNEAGFQCSLKIIQRILAEADSKKVKRSLPTSKPRSPSRPGFSPPEGYEDSRGDDYVPGMSLDVHFSGFGKGREAFLQAMISSEGDGVRSLVHQVWDRTPIKIGGTRSKKARRL